MDENKMTFKPVTLIELKLRVKKWPNQSERHHLPLVSPIFLRSIYEAIDAASSIINSITFPLPWREGRFCNMTDYSLRDLDLIADPQHMLYLAVKELQQRWPGVIKEAKARLGRRFAENDFPSAEELTSLYGLGYRLVPDNYICTQDVLGKYSKYYAKPEEHTIYDAIEWCRKMEAELRQKKTRNRSGIQFFQ